MTEHNHARAASVEQHHATGVVRHDADGLNLVIEVARHGPAQRVVLHEPGWRGLGGQRSGHARLRMMLNATERRTSTRESFQRSLKAGTMGCTHACDDGGMLVGDARTSGVFLLSLLNLRRLT